MKKLQLSLTALFAAYLLVFANPAHAAGGESTGERKSTAETESLELANLREENRIVEQLKKDSEQKVGEAKNKMTKARSDAARAVLATQKAKQSLEKRKSTFSDKKNKIQDTRMKAKEEEEKKRLALQMQARKGEEQKNATTSILSDLYDAKKIENDLPSLSTLDALQGKLRELQAIRSRAEERNSKIIAMYSERIPQAEQAINDIETIVSKLRDKINSITTQASVVTAPSTPAVPVPTNAAK